MSDPSAPISTTSLPSSAAPSFAGFITELPKLWAKLQEGLRWLDENQDKVRKFGEDVQRRGGSDDAWRYLFSKTSGITALTMAGALELERRVAPSGNPGRVLTLLLGDTVGDEALLADIRTQLRIAPMSEPHRQQLITGIDHVEGGRYAVAGPLLILAIEGVLWRMPAERGLIEQDKRGKWRTTDKTSRPGMPVGGIEAALKLPELAVDQAYVDFVTAVVYGGAGNPYRHGTATIGWDLRSYFLLVALMGWLELNRLFDTGDALHQASARAQKQNAALTGSSSLRRDAA